ncbi:uncharacterized protein BDR25DRAFT_5339 [Lindgomyces ingoldianus]|uniref:Uncharacterized protein n=1 Tax=Lindgomyces ingoldianus TaxID=673940 RepID=A0ACB6RHG1_9PLEO|nr:uncharacterized protein BDR25DRAFT_5339 [Lindgomyces ingoldianus]KAF2477906.1 hypothetical protein BDR25DRAFT_5339 [Lindgomyces ingoldianus]
MLPKRHRFCGSVLPPVSPLYSHEVQITKSVLSPHEAYLRLAFARLALFLEAFRTWRRVAWYISLADKCLLYFSHSGNKCLKAKLLNIYFGVLVPKNQPYGIHEKDRAFDASTIPRSKLPPCCFYAPSPRNSLGLFQEARMGQWDFPALKGQIPAKYASPLKRRKLTAAPTMIYSYSVPQLPWFD